MDFSWELEQLGRAAAPNIVLDGVQLLPHVSDLLQHGDGSVEALVRSENPHVASLTNRYPLHEPACTCGDSRPFTACAHAIAVRLRILQDVHGLEELQIDRWTRNIEAFLELERAWELIARVWLEAKRCGDDSAAAGVFRQTGSLEAGLAMARALADLTNSDELSTFLVDLARSRDIDGESRLFPQSIIDAGELVGAFGHPLTGGRPGARAAALVAVAGSARRTATFPTDDFRVTETLMNACRALGGLVADEHADSATVADTLLRADLASPRADYPWIAMILEALGPGAKQVAQHMSDMLETVNAPQGAEITGEQRYRLRAEIAFAHEGISGLLPVLEEWPDAPYGEFLFRLPGSWSPASRDHLLESAHRVGRVRWAPGWPQHGPVPSRHYPARFVHDRAPDHPMWGDIAIGDLVQAIARLGREAEARAFLLEHAERLPAARHRYEFLRVWRSAGLRGDAESMADDIFGPSSDGLGDLLSALARIPDRYFCVDLAEIRGEIGSALLTAILFEDILPEGHARHLEAPMWAASFFSWFPEAADDLNVIASLPTDAVSENLEGAVLDRHLGARIRRVAGQLVDAGCPVRSLADLDRLGEGPLIDALERAPDAGPATAALVSAVLGGARTAELEPLLAEFLRSAAGNAPASGPLELLEHAFAVEPRHADPAAYKLAVILASLGGWTSF